MQRHIMTKMVVSERFVSPKFFNIDLCIKLYHLDKQNGTNVGYKNVLVKTEIVPTWFDS